MKELKTLKDLRRDVPLTTPTSTSLLKGVLLETELKAEAVKWVNNYGEGIEEFFCGELNVNEADSIIKWIKHFFNLTEEDLK